MSINANAETPYSGVVTIPEFTAYMNNMNLDVNRQDVAATVLYGVQQELERYCNRPVQLVQVREFVQCDNDGCVTLRVTPILKVIKRQAVNPVNQNVFPIDWAPYVPDPMTRDDTIGENGRMIDATPQNFGAPIVVPGGIYVGGFMGSWYFVEYVGGYDGNADASLKLDIMRVASREMIQHHDDTLSLRQGDAEEASTPDPRPVGWQDDELIKWDRIRRRVVV